MWFPTSLHPRSLISYHSITQLSHSITTIWQPWNVGHFFFFFFFGKSVFRVMSGAIASSWGIGEVVFVLRNMMTAWFMRLLGCISVHCNNHLFTGPGIGLAGQAPSGSLLSDRTKNGSSRCTFLPQPWMSHFPKQSWFLLVGNMLRNCNPGTRNILQVTPGFSVLHRLGSGSWVKRLIPWLK